MYDLVELLTLLPKLEQLDISHCRLDENSLKLLFSGNENRLNIWNSLTDLIIESINLGTYENTEVFESFKTFLDTGNNLTKLHFGGNSLSISGTESILACCKFSHKLKNLKISQQRMDSSWMESIFAQLKWIKYLDLSNCLLGDKLASLLIIPISESFSLSLLNLSGNNLSDEFMKEFWEALKYITESSYNSEIEDSMLRTPYLGQEHSDDTSVSIINEEVKSISAPALESLDLSQNKITDEGIQHFSNLLSSNSWYIKHLLNIDLLDNRITEKGFKSLKKSIKNRPRKTYLAIN